MKTPGAMLVILAGAAALAAASPPAAAQAAEPLAVASDKCLSTAQQRHAVGSGRAVSLAAAISASRRRVPGEVVRAQLCHQADGGLVYVLTVLARNGKVSRALVDAADGAVAGVH